MSLVQIIKQEILLARKARDKDKSGFLNWFVSDALKALSSNSKSAVTEKSITDEFITKHANKVYTTHKKTLDTLSIDKHKEAIDKLRIELSYLKPYTTMGLNPEQIEFIKEYRAGENRPHNLGAFNKALSQAFKSIDRQEARELYESL